MERLVGAVLVVLALAGTGLAQDAKALAKEACSYRPARCIGRKESVSTRVAS